MDGPDRMNGWPSGDPPNGMRVGWGRAFLSVHGWPSLLLIALLAIIGSNLYVASINQRGLTDLTATMVQQQEHRRKEHRGLENDLDKTSCVLTMSPAERTQFRLEYRRGAWTRWCPWVEDNERDTRRMP